MLKEILNAGQSSTTENRRWFSDSEMDLFVWEDGESNIIRIQLCYSKGQDEHAFTWQLPDRFSHHRIDDGEQKGFGHKSSPILVPDGQFDSKLLEQRFVSKSPGLDPDLVGFVCKKLDEWGADGD